MDRCTDSTRGSPPVLSPQVLKQAYSGCAQNLPDKNPHAKCYLCVSCVRGSGLHHPPSLMGRWQCSIELRGVTSQMVQGEIAGQLAAAKDDITSAVENLKIGEGNVETSLDEMLRSVNDNASVSNKLCSLNVLEVIAKQLEVSKDIACLAKMSQLVAEMTKTESIRKPCVEAGLIPPLVNIMNHEDTEVVLQTSRALGNICFDNDEARALIDQSGGLEKLMDLMKNRCLSTSDNANQKLRVVVCGHLLNLTNSNESIHSKIFSLGAISALQEFLSKFSNDVSLCEMVLLCLDSLLETESGRMELSSSGIIEILVQLLQQHDDEEIHETILEIISVLAENASEKKQLESRSGWEVGQNENCIRFQVETWLLTLWCQMERWLLTLWGQVETWLLTLWCQMERWLLTLWGQVETWLLTLWCQLETWLSTLWGQVETWLLTLWGQVETWLLILVPSGDMAPNTVVSSGDMAPNTGVNGDMAPNTVVPSGDMAPNTVGPNGEMAPNTVGPSGDMAPNTVVPIGDLALNTVGPSGDMAPNTDLALNTVVPSGDMAPNTVVPSGDLALNTVGPSRDMAPNTVVPIGDLALNTVGPSRDMAPNTVVPSGDMAPNTVVSMETWLLTLWVETWLLTLWCQMERWLLTLWGQVETWLLTLWCQLETWLSTLLGQVETWLLTLVPSGDMAPNTVVPSGDMAPNTVVSMETWLLTLWCQVETWLLTLVPSGDMAPNTVVPSGDMAPNTVVPSGDMAPNTVVPSGDMAPNTVGPSGDMAPNTVHDMAPNTVVPSGDMASNTVVPSGDMAPNTVGPSGDMASNTVVPSGDMASNTVVPSGDMAPNTVGPSGDMASNTVVPSGDMAPNTVVPSGDMAPNTVVPNMAPNAVVPSGDMAPNTVVPSGDMASNTVVPSGDMAPNTVGPSGDMAPNTVVPSRDMTSNTVVPSGDMAPNTVVPSTDMTPNTVVPSRDMTSNTVVPSGDMAPNTVVPSRDMTPNTVVPSRDMTSNTVVPSGDMAPNTVVPSRDMTPNTVGSSGDMTPNTVVSMETWLLTLWCQVETWLLTLWCQVETWLLTLWCQVETWLLTLWGQVETWLLTLVPMETWLLTMWCQMETWLLTLWCQWRLGCYLVKVKFSKYHLAEILAGFMNSHRGYQANFSHKSRRSSEAFSLEKAATDIIVLLLTEDESMNLIFNNGNGQVLKEVMIWLQSPSNQRKISGALVIGNFARSDEHCIKLVECGVLKPLQDVLQTPTGSTETDMKLQHAVLSAFRNLAIPAVNKAIMLKCGVLDTVLSLIRTDMTPVQFKLLATIRMLVDGQASAAVQVGGNRAIVKRIVELCDAPDHAGVAGEANRLIAALVKNSSSIDVMEVIVSSDGLPHAVTMATSEYMLMQNEALVAMTLIASQTLETTESVFISCNITQLLQRLLSESDTQPEVTVNVLTLTEMFLQSATLKKLIKENGIDSIVKKLCSHDNHLIKDKAKVVHHKMKS
uniref:Uncharacterized protein LOC102806195 n=1 Tax=Saccoglossus kowalevskii TaxID=10224 RepID=A0ABM0M1J5_SACKO|nr:PREDICTED: uncharacterized protein LOC102806195 [Saccoglossus kowalevskii]